MPTTQVPQPSSQSFPGIPCPCKHQKDVHDGPRLNIRLAIFFTAARDPRSQPQRDPENSRGAGTYEKPEGSVSGQEQDQEHTVLRQGPRHLKNAKISGKSSPLGTRCYHRGKGHLSVLR